MIRWKYVVPRIATIAVIALAIYLGADWVTKFALVRTGEALLGSRVELGAVDLQLTRGRMSIDEIVIADPDSAFRNLLQAESADFDIEMHAALRRKLIVRDGSIDGIQFHTARETDGIIQSAEDDTDGSSSVFGHLKSVGKRGEDWLDDSIEKFETDFESELQTVQLSKQLKERWPLAYRSVETQGKRLEQQARLIRDQAKRIGDDPIKHVSEIQPAMGAIEQFRRDVLQLRNQVAGLQRQFQQDRLALEEAKRHDLTYVRNKLRLDQLDGDSLSEYLLGPVWSERIETAIRWIHRSRGLVGEEPETSSDPAFEGITVLFPGFPSSADVLIRQLRLSGAGTANGNSYQFQGTAKNLTHQPARHAEPATVQINADGAIQMVAEAILDRRREIPEDRFVVRLPSVAQHGQVLGNPDKLAVEISPGRANMLFDIVVQDDQLAGKITMAQPNIQLKPTLPKKYSKYVQPENVAAALANVQTLEAVVELGGQLKKPTYHLTSNLGPQIATGLNQALQQELMARQQQLLQLANKEVDEQLNTLQQDLMKKQGDLLGKLELGDEQLGQLKELLASKLGGSAGKLLNSIFK